MKKFVNGEYIDMTQEEIDQFDENPNGLIVATEQDRSEAQVLYTAIMTDTLLGGIINV